MTFYDIHTHNLDHSDKYAITTIKNTTPNTFNTDFTEGSRIYFSCGIHPWHSDSWKEQLEQLKQISCYNQILAIGEAGLDKIRGWDMTTQIEVFKSQIQLSEEIQKPIIIHCVKSWDILLSIHSEVKPTQPWIIHGFRGKPTLAKQLTQKGIYVSIGEKYNEQTIKEIPINMLFCETDESSFSICEIYTNVSHTLGITVSDLAYHIQNNFNTLFSGI